MSDLFPKDLEEFRSDFNAEAGHVWMNFWSYVRGLIDNDTLDLHLPDDLTDLENAVDLLLKHYEEELKKTADAINAQYDSLYLSYMGLQVQIENYYSKLEGWPNDTPVSQ